MIVKYKALIEYLGKNFFGWQIQPNLITIQGEIERALYRITKNKIRVIGSGRTDTGVNALGQVAHFEIEEFSDEEKLKNAINGNLTDNIRIINIKKVHKDFHSRFDAIERQYLYKVYRGNKTPFKKDMVWFINYKLSLEKISKASLDFIGKKDFTSFAIKKSQEKNKIVDLRSLEIKVYNNEIIFLVKADRFLHKMVRTIIGTLIEIGRGKDNYNIKNILKNKNREYAGPSAPPEGLYLYKVIYN